MSKTKQIKKVGVTAFQKYMFEYMRQAPVEVTSHGKTICYVFPPEITKGLKMEQTVVTSSLNVGPEIFEGGEHEE